MFFNYHGCPYANETLSANIYNVLHTHKHFCCYLYDKNVYTYIKYIVFQSVFNKYIFYKRHAGLGYEKHNGISTHRLFHGTTVFFAALFISVKKM